MLAQDDPDRATNREFGSGRTDKMEIRLALMRALMLIVADRHARRETMWE
ncbi:MAG: hypothetical protein ACLPTZ_12730 [Beijerinckiaceae bacterium]